MHTCTDNRAAGRLAGGMTTAQTRRPHPAPADIDLRQDLAVGLHAVTEFNQSIRYADTKAAGLAAVQALAVTVLAAKRDAVPDEPVALVLFLICLGAVLTSAFLLAAGQSPRMSGKRRSGGSRIAFPALAELPLDEILRTPSLTRQHEQVWRQAAELAAIAVTKYRWLHRAMAGTLLTLTAVLLWLGVATWLMPR